MKRKFTKKEVKNKQFTTTPEQIRTKEDKNKDPDLKEFKWSIDHENYHNLSKKMKLDYFIKNTIKKLNHCNKSAWQDALKQNKGNKLCIDNIKTKHKARMVNLKEKIHNLHGEDVSFYKLRIDNKHRIVGYRVGGIFYLCVDDLEHELTGN